MSDHTPALDWVYNERLPDLLLLDEVGPVRAQFRKPKTKIHPPPDGLWHIYSVATGAEVGHTNDPQMATLLIWLSGEDELARAERAAFRAAEVAEHGEPAFLCMAGHETYRALRTVFDLIWPRCSVCDGPTGDREQTLAYLEMKRQRGAAP